MSKGKRKVKVTGNLLRQIERPKVYNIWPDSDMGNYRLLEDILTGKKKGIKLA